MISAIGYGLAVLWLIGRETELVFRAGSTLATGRPQFPYEEIDLTHPDGLTQFGWVMRTGDSDTGPWVLYLHGSASSVASQVNIAHYRVLRNAGLNVLAPEYRGFGGLPGTPTEATLQADARAAYDYLRNTRRIPPESIVIYGWSLGAAVAVDMAARVTPSAIILEGAPASLLDLTGRHYPFFPLRLFMRSSFDSIRKIGTIPAPVLVLHSVDDELIPISEGRRLHAAARGAKMFVELRGGHIGAIDRSASILEEAVRTFLRSHGTGRLLESTKGM